MATATRTAPPASGPVPYRLDVRQFLTMIAAGVFGPEERIELLGGVLVQKMTRHAPHNFTVGRLSALLRDLIAPDRLVREEKPVVLGRDWRPEPDIAVIRGPDDHYRRADPTAADLALLVEVAESTYPLDRGEKWRAYAAARVPVYWIVDLSSRAVEVFTDPAGRGKTARYRAAARFGPGEAIPVVVDGRELGAVAVNEILP